MSAPGDAFVARLATVPRVGLEARLMTPGRGDAEVDLRAATVLVVGGLPCGVANAVAAALAVTGVESHRMLMAVAKCLAELVQAPPEEIAPRMAELGGSLETIVAHVNESSELITSAIQALEPKDEVH